MRASGGETAGAITTSCCAPARLRQHHDTVPYREALVSWLLRERLGQADQNDLIWMPRLVIPEVPPTVQNECLFVSRGSVGRAQGAYEVPFGRCRSAS